ncbi:MAG: hypothetical protein ABSE68_00720 [Minisyncoccia bacterium]
MAIFKQKVLLIFLGLTAALFMSSFILSFFELSGSSYPIILHFEPFRGVDLIGNMTDFWSIWASGFIFAILNTWLAEILFYRERFLSYLFIAANVLISVLILIISGVIIGAN